MIRKLKEREKSRHGELGKVERRFGIMEWGVIKRVDRRQKGDWSCDSCESVRKN